MPTNAAEPPERRLNRFTISPDEIEQLDHDRLLRGLLECDQHGCAFTIEEGFYDAVHGRLVVHNGERRSFSIRLPESMAYGYIQDQRAPLGVTKRVNLVPRPIFEWIHSLHEAADERTLDTDGWALHAAMLVGCI